jgi:hypothetical protein
MLRDEITKTVYEATRVEAEWSGRQIVPEPWEQREEAFRKQFVKIIEDYLGRDRLPTPEEAHNSWMESYIKMGWMYGGKRDVAKKTHPDLVPYNYLPQDEKDKDAIFLAFVWEVKSILALIDAQRCVWTKDGTINGQETYYTSCDMVDFLEGYDFCPKCGKRIEVKEGEDART